MNSVTGQIRVLVLTDTNVGGHGGAEKHLESLVSRVDPARFSFHIVQFGQKGVPQAEGRIGCATFTSIPMPRLLSLVGLRRVAQVYRILRARSYDVVLSFFETSDLIAVLVGKLMEDKALISSRRDTGFRHSRKMRLAYRLINGQFKTIIAASEAVRDALLADGVPAHGITVIHNGIDPVRFTGKDGQKVRREIGIGADATVLGMVANLYPVKNHSLVIECVQRLHRSGCAVHLILVGDGPQRENLEHQAKRYGLGHFVHFLGRRSDVDYLFAATDIVVLASHTEGLSNALLEAMASGKAVVATLVGGNPEVIQDGVNGYLVAADDATAMTGAIQRLIESPSLRSSVGHAAQTRVREHFSVTRMIGGYSAVLERAVSAASDSQSTVHLRE